jgi:putative endonuclease
MDPAQFIAAASRRFLNALCPSEGRLRSWLASLFPPPLPHSLRLGRQGERLAARFLRKNGYRILLRNFHPHHGGEVDLVCRLPAHPELVFVEVKTRSSEDFGSPHQFVDAKQQKRLIQAAESWLEMLGRQDVSARFDILEVIALPHAWEIRHLPNAFLAREPLHPGSLPTTLAATPAHARPKDARASVARFPRRRFRC